MTPTQYQFLTQQLGEIKTSVDGLDKKLDAALLTQAEHAVKIRLILWAGGVLGTGLVTAGLGLALALAKSLLHI